MHLTYCGDGGKVLSSLRRQMFHIYLGLAVKRIAHISKKKKMLKIEDLNSFYRYVDHIFEKLCKMIENVFCHHIAICYRNEWSSYR